MRLGRKYDIQQLYSEALTRLEFEFPSTLEGYDRSANSWTLISSSDLDVGCALVSAVINLGRENDILHILPVAFYIICRCHTGKELIEAMEQSEGPALRELSVFDRRAVIKGWHSLVERQATETLKWLVQEDIFITICTAYECPRNRRQHLHEYWFPQVSCSALEAWRSGWDEDYCKACALKSKELHDSGRRKIWEELPLFFGLPGWEELTKKT